VNIPEISVEIIQPLIERIEILEAKLNDTEKRLKTLEENLARLGDPGSVIESPIVSYQFEKIELLRSRGKTQEYIEELEKMLNQDPTSLVILNMLGNAYLKEQSWNQAKKAFDQILQKDPQNFNSLLGLAMVYHFTRRSQLALDLLEQAQKISPTSKKVNKMLNAVRQALGRSTVISIEEQPSVHEELKENALSDEGRELDLQEAPLMVEKSSSDVDTDLPKGRLDTKHQEDDETRLEYPSSRIQRDMDEIEKFYDEFMERGKHYYQTRKLEAAFQMFSEAAKLKPDTLKSWHNLGVVAESIGNRKQAQEAFSRALAICESNEDFEGEKKYQKWLAKL
jgi:tetratricopeptide (TPR) repeat protein